MGREISVEWDFNGKHLEAKAKFDTKLRLMIDVPIC